MDFEAGGAIVPFGYGGVAAERIESGLWAWLE